MPNRTSIIEPLERRRLLAAAIDASGNLLIEGTAKNDRVWVSGDDAGTTISVLLNNDTHDFNAADVQSIVIDTRRGDDVVVIFANPNGGAIAKPITVWCHAGRDSILGGPGPEKLF